MQAPDLSDIPDCNGPEPFVNNSHPMLVEILTAVSLILVLEGLLPFINPNGYKNTIRLMLELPESRMRMIGLCSMIAGVVLLTLVR